MWDTEERLESVRQRDHRNRKRKSHRDTIAAFFSGHFHCGLRGWSDNFGIHEVVLPATSWNRDRRLQKAPGFSLNEFRTGYVMADVFANQLILRYKPLGAEVRAKRSFSI